jgi:Dolichyl-phosphate-mannose-protein mannosyltransferase
MIHAWIALASAAFVVAACWAAGVLAISYFGAKLNRIESIPLEFLTGACVLHLAIFAIMAAKIAYKPALLILLTAFIVAGATQKRPRAAEILPKHWTLVLFSVIFAIYSVVYLVAAWVPETSADGSGYHLEIVEHYLHAHGFVQIPTNMYSALGQGVELIYAPAVAFGGFSAAALVHFAFLIALAWLIFAYGARLAKPYAGAAAALIVYLSPIVGRDGTSAYIDVATAAIVFAAFYWLEIWDSSRDSRILIPVGLLAGYAYAAKFTACVMVLYALAFIAWRSRRLRPALLAGLCSAIVIAPWMLKNWIYFHNPVAPFADEIFPNPYVHPVAEQQWAEYLRTYDIPKFQRLPGQVTLRGDYTQGIVGPVFLLAPLALLLLRRAAGWRLLLPGFAMLAVYFGNIGTRFLIPCLAFFALGIALAIGHRWLLAALVIAHAVLSWPSQITRYSSPYIWRIEKFDYKAALRITPEEKYLEQHIADYAELRMLAENIPAGEPVFATGDLGWIAYSSREIIDHFRSAFGNTMWDIINTGWAESTQPLGVLVFHFPETSATRIRVVQTAPAEKYQQWSVHELRFFDRASEIPRDRNWRLRAWPNPYEVQLAFDHSQATRWRTWQTVAPGMYLDVDFRAPKNVDEVRIETSPDSWTFPLRVEKWEQGRWTALTDHFKLEPNQVTNGIRRSATYELLRRGIHYVVVRDRDFGGADYTDDPESWGLEEVAHVAGATLYKILP